MYTGYYIDNNYIYGPTFSGQFYIDNNYIYGPQNGGKYYIDNNYIYGPKKSGKFYIEDQYIYGPDKILPWLGVRVQLPSSFVLNENRRGREATLTKMFIQKQIETYINTWFEFLQRLILLTAIRVTGSVIEGFTLRFVVGVLYTITYIAFFYWLLGALSTKNKWLNAITGGIIAVLSQILIELLSPIISKLI